MNYRRIFFSRDQELPEGYEWKWKGGLYGEIEHNGDALIIRFANENKRQKGHLFKPWLEYEFEMRKKYLEIKWSEERKGRENKK